MQKVQRIGAVDLLRGLVMFTMVYANCGYFKMPWWAGHLAIDGNANGITYVDVILPAFFCLAGVSIPLAFARYEDTLKGLGTKLWHVLARSVSLVVMGLLMVNDQFNLEKMGGDEKLFGFLGGYGHFFWVFLVCFMIFLTWQQYKGTNKIGIWVSNGLRIVGIGMVIWFFNYYTSKWGGGMSSSWWGILGLIGRIYFACSLIYILVGKRIELLGMALLLCYTIYLLSFLGELNSFWQLALGHSIKPYFGQISLMMLGVMVGAKILQVQSSQLDEKGRHKEFLTFIAIYAVITFIIGYLLEDAYGIHKNNSIPAYAYVCVGITSSLLFIAYFVCDVLKMDNVVTRYLIHVGSVPLTCYIMAPMLTGLTNIIWLGEKPLYYYLFKSLGPWVETLGGAVWMQQWAGALQTIFFAFVVTGICIFMKKHKIFLKV